MNSSLLALVGAKLGGGILRESSRFFCTGRVSVRLVGERLGFLSGVVLGSYLGERYIGANLIGNALIGIVFDSRPEEPFTFIKTLGFSTLLKTGGAKYPSTIALAFFKSIDLLYYLKDVRLLARAQRA